MRVLVVGAGIVGLATAWALVKRRHAVTLLEQSGSIPNPFSASGDQHRIIRRAYGELDGYAHMITEAFEAWEEMWRDLQRSYYVPCGGLVISQQRGDSAEGLRQGLDRLGRDYDLLLPAEASRRYPFLDPNTFRYAILSREAGVLLSRRIATDLARWLLEQGVEVRTGARVASVDEITCRVELDSGEAMEADRLLLALGAWTPKFLPQLAGELQSFRTAVAYLEPPEDLRPAWQRAPAILDLGGTADGYVLPPVAGTALKAGFGVHKRPSSDPNKYRMPEPGEAERLCRLLSPPIARPERYKVIDVATCAYAFTHDRRFFAREAGRAIIVSACSGHGYKFGAAIGRRVASAVNDGDAAALGRWLRAEHDVPPCGRTLSLLTA